MKNIRPTILSAAIMVVMMTGGCERKSDEKAPALTSPDKAPMALDANPPMSAADIDAIVNESRSQVAAPHSRPTDGNKSDAN